jgi:tetratricopeptide (TPR) repeat protein
MTGRAVQEGIEQAKALAKTNRYEEALALVDHLLRSHMAEPELWAARAFVAAHGKDYETAEQAIGRAIDLEQSEPDYVFTRGRYRLRSEQFSQAVADFTRTLELCDQLGSDYYREPAYFLRAEAYLAQGMVNEARADCEHVRDETVVWNGSVRSKKDILADCDRIA